MRNCNPLAFFKDSKYVRHQNQIFLLMMIMGCSSLRLKQTYFLKSTDTRNIPATNFLTSVGESCPISRTVLEVMTKLFACYAIFQETVCDNGLRISLPSHTRHFVSGDHLWMFITKLKTLLSSTH